MKVRILSCTATKYLLDKITDPELEKYKQDILKVETFSDGEIAVKFTESVRGANIYLFAETSKPENLVELMFTLDAAHLASARSVTLFIPYFGYCRQDRQEGPRGSMGAALIAKMITSRDLAPIVDQIVTIDLHAEQEVGFFNTAVNHIRAHSFFIDAVKEIITPDTKLWAPDAGGAKRVEKYASHLGLTMGGINKRRERPNEIASMDLVGDPSGKDIILIDDIMDTAGTACKAASKLKEAGAKSVTGIFTHPVLSGKAWENLKCCQFDRIIFSDTIELKACMLTNDYPEIKVISCMPIIEKVILSIINDYSVSEISD